MMEAGSGERLGRYVLTRRLGAGGMAEVFEAVDELLRRRVAVKVVRGPLAESGEFTTRFLREARLAAQLRHPNVVPIYDVGVDRGVLFVVMPVLEGGTLSDRVQAGVADATSLGWLAELASALDYDWLEPDQRHGLALKSTQRMLLVNNSCDRILAHYRLLACDRHGPPALGYCGVRSRAALGPDGENVRQFDACCEVGSQHMWRLYVGSETIMAQVRETVLPK